MPLPAPSVRVWRFPTCVWRGATEEGRPYAQVWWQTKSASGYVPASDRTGQFQRISSFGWEGYFEPVYRLERVAVSVRERDSDPRPW